MRRGYTLIEIIITIAITGVLSAGMFKAFEAITIRSEKAKILTTLSIDSQSALDQISILLYNRVPSSVEGCTLTEGCIPLDESINKKILTWYGLASESYKARYYSAFVDMNCSDYSTKTLCTPNTDLSAVLATEQKKWENFDIKDMGLIFSSSSDQGEKYTYTISNTAINTITIDDPQSDMNISEKYNLVDSAYAVALGSDIDTTAPCIIDLNLSTTLLDNTLLLFYDYRPWKTPAESFCADNATTRVGKVTVLTTRVNAFSAQTINGIIRLSIDMNQTVSGSNNPVRLSKQKVVF